MVSLRVVHDEFLLVLVPTTSTTSIIVSLSLPLLLLLLRPLLLPIMRVDKTAMTLWTNGQNHYIGSLGSYLFLFSIWLKVGIRYQPNLSCCASQGKCPLSHEVMEPSALHSIFPKRWVSSPKRWGTAPVSYFIAMLWRFSCKPWYWTDTGKSSAWSWMRVCLSVVFKGRMYFSLCSIIYIHMYTHFHMGFVNWGMKFCFLNASWHDLPWSLKSPYDLSYKISFYK